MMRRLLLLGAVAVLFGASTDTFAQGYYDRGRGDRGDRTRIRRGVRSGQLTRAEALALRQRERLLRQQRRAYRSDGVLTREERREIRRNERAQDRLIRRERRDADRNPYFHGRDRRRGNGYYRRGAGSPRHPVFGTGGRRYRY